MPVVEPHVIRREAALAGGAAAAAGSAADLDLAAGADIVIAPTAPVPVAPFEVFEKELTVIGSNSLGNCCPAAVELMPDLAAVMEGLVTHTVPLRDYQQAVEIARSPEALKVHVDPTS